MAIDVWVYQPFTQTSAIYAVQERLPEINLEALEMLLKYY